ncbi:hypothetical protein D3C75_859430 [compost metagenome]
MLTCLIVLNRLWIGSHNRFDDLLDRPLITDLHETLLFNDCRRKLTALQHLLEDGFGDFAADGSACDQANHFTQPLRGDLHLGQFHPPAVQIPQQIAHHPVGNGFGILRISKTALEEIRERLGGSQYTGIVGGKSIFLAVTALPRIRQLRNGCTN